MKRQSLVLLLALALGAGALLWAGTLRSERPAVQYELAPVTRGDLAANVTATGTLSPLVTVQVGSQVTGRIQELRADFNSKVAKGEVIAVIDPRLFETELAEARANRAAAAASVERARAELTNARLASQRAESLAARDLGPRADADAKLAAFQSAEAQLASAQASLAQAGAAVEQAETQLAYTTIMSPIDGVVISRDVELGQTVAASLQAPTLFTIAEDLAKMELHTNVSEADVGRLTPGMAAEFTVDAHPNETFRGAVREIRYSPQTVQNVVTYDAVVAVDNARLLLRPGMTADVAFEVERRSDVLLVPNAALRFQPPPEALAAATPPEPAAPGSGRERVVWTVGAGGRLEPRRVRIGVSDGRLTELTGDGVEPGLEVVTGVVGGEPAAPGPRGNPRFGRFL